MSKSNNKPKAWRRMSKKYYDEEKGVWVRPGRQLKMFTMGYDTKAAPFGLIKALINKIDFDYTTFMKRYEKKVKNETK